MTRASRRKYHITYKTTCTITGRYYFGLHSTDNLEDGYLGSGVRLKRSVAKHGRENHKRKILATFASRKEAADHEKALITEEIRLDRQCMNCASGGQGLSDRPDTTKDDRQKISEGNLNIGLQPLLEERLPKSRQRRIGRIQSIVKNLQRAYLGEQSLMKPIY